MRRSLAVVVAAVVTFSVLVPAAFATGADAQEATPVDSCTVIDEPGEYELVADVESDGADSCIVIQADNVTIDGNGHALEGPGAETDAVGIDLDSDMYSYDVEIRNVEITGWGDAIHAGGGYELSNAVVHDNGVGLKHRQGRADQLTDVVIENNGYGISSVVGWAYGTNVTIRSNQQGMYAEDGGEYEFDASEIRDNEEYGAYVGHYTDLNLTDSTVSGNGDHGIRKSHTLGSADLNVEGTTVSNNAGDGIRVRGPVDARLTDVTVEDNGGLEVNAHVNEDFATPIDASDLRVGDSATTAFEAEPVQLEPVDGEDLPDRDGGTAVGDGLEVGGNVTDAVDLTLDVDTDDESVDLWRHDGDWETVEEDLDASDGTVEATVDSTGTYAPGTEADDQDDSDEQDDGDTGDDGEDSDDSEDDDSDDSEDDGSEDEPSDKDGDKKKHTPSDEDGDEDDEAETGSDGSSSGGSSSGSSGSSSTATETPTATPTPTETVIETPDEEATESPDSDQQRDDEGGTATDDVDGDETTDDDDALLADGPGFSAVAALVALLAAALLAGRRR